MSVDALMAALAAFALVIGSAGVSHAASHAAHSEPAEAEGDAAADAKVRGVELGEYRIRSYYPVEAQKSTVRFVLHAAVPSERFPQVQQVVDSNRHKLRDQVITATRMAPLTVFDEPELKRFRRLILVRLGRVLPELAIDDVYVSDFQLVVKSL